MKKFRNILLISALFVFIGASSSSCRRATCPANENAHVKTNKRGELPTKRGKSSLFSKKQRKRMRSVPR